MDFITLLRKLNILRFGVKKYQYTSGRDMPARALLDDVYDEEKDLVTGQDFRDLKEAVTKKISKEES